MNGIPGSVEIPCGWRCDVVTAGRLILVRVGEIEIEVEEVLVAGTEPTLGRAARNLLEAFGRAQHAIIDAEVAGKASLKVTRGYNVAPKPITGPPLAMAGNPLQEPSAGSS